MVNAYCYSSHANIIFGYATKVQNRSDPLLNDYSTTLLRWLDFGDEYNRMVLLFFFFV